MLNAFTLLRMYTINNNYTRISEDGMSVYYTLYVIHFFVCFVRVYYTITVIGKVYPHTGVTRNDIYIFTCVICMICVCMFYPRSHPYMERCTRISKDIRQVHNSHTGTVSGVTQYGEGTPCMLHNMTVMHLFFGCVRTAS